MSFLRSVAQRIIPTPPINIVNMTNNPDKIHELAHNIISYVHDLQDKCDNKPIVSEEDKQTIKNALQTRTFTQKIIIGLFLDGELAKEKNQNDRIRKRNEKAFKIAVASINAQPDLFKDVCRKNILDEINKSTKVKELFKDEAGEAFMALLAKPFKQEVEVKPLTPRQQLLSCIEKNYTSDGDIDAVDKNGFTKLSWAAYFGDTDFVNGFLKEPADPNITDHYGTTALIRAGDKKHFAICRELIRNGADPKIRAKRGEGRFISALSQAIAADQLDIVQIILNDPKFKMDSQLARECFFLTISSNKMDSFMLFINKGMNVNFLDLDPIIQRSPLMLAAQQNNLPMLQVLVQNGADLLMQDTNENLVRRKPGAWTAYEYARYQYGKPKSLYAMRLLLEPILKEEKYVSQNIIKPETILEDFEYAETADRYTILKLLYEYQQKVIALNDPRVPCLNEAELMALKETINSLRLANQQICQEIDSSLKGIAVLPDAVLNIIDEYGGHPHDHLLKPKM